MQFMTPGGIPALTASETTNSVEKGLVSLAFTMTTLPAAKAGAIFMK